MSTSDHPVRNGTGPHGRGSRLRPVAGGAVAFVAIVPIIEDETDDELLREVSARFGLGSLTSPSRARHGGVNRLWRVQTQRGAFAVHLLSDDGVDGDPVLRSQEVFELEVAARDAGVPLAAPVPEPRSGQACLRVGRAQRPVTVHEWVDASTVSIGRTPHRLYRQLGTALARIHRLGLVVPASRPDALTRRTGAAEWRYLASQATRSGWAWGAAVERAADDFGMALATVDAWDRSAAEPTVYSHRDLTAGNILDLHGAPILIDWEDAGPIGRGNEIGRTALDNVIRNGWLDFVALRHYLHGYSEIVPVPPVGAHWCSLWIRGLLVYAEHCARSCLQGTADRSLLHHQAHVLETTLTELGRRLEMTPALVETFHEATPH